MKKTIYIPDELAERLSDYLREHPQETLSSVVQNSLAAKLESKDVSKLLKLAGIVKNAPRNASENAEDYLV